MSLDSPTWTEACLHNQHNLCHDDTCICRCHTPETKSSIIKKQMLNFLEGRYGQWFRRKDLAHHLGITRTSAGWALQTIKYVPGIEHRGIYWRYIESEADYDRRMAESANPRESQDDRDFLEGDPQ